MPRVRFVVLVARESSVCDVGDGSDVTAAHLLTEMGATLKLSLDAKTTGLHVEKKPTDSDYATLGERSDSEIALWLREFKRVELTDKIETLLDGSVDNASDIYFIVVPGERALLGDFVVADQTPRLTPSTVAPEAGKSQQDASWIEWCAPCAVFLSVVMGLTVWIDHNFLNYGAPSAEPGCIADMPQLLCWAFALPCVAMLFGAVIFVAHVSTQVWPKALSASGGFVLDNRLCITAVITALVVLFFALAAAPLTRLLTGGDTARLDAFTGIVINVIRVFSYFVLLTT